MGPFQFLAAGVCAAGIANAAYVIQDTFDKENFFSSFEFFDDPDPTKGFVEYLDPSAANLSQLAGYSENSVYLGVDHVTLDPESGRSSVRVTSKSAYTHGLFVADIAHMPSSTCGSWPAFWTVGKDWPGHGEIDIIEGVNNQATTSVTLHTSPGCTLQSTGALASSQLGNTDCNNNNGFSGCGFSTADPSNYGDGFNAIGGGVYAMEWTTSAIKVHFFPRASIPADIVSGSPNPTTWGPPIAAFSGGGCDIDQHFKQHNIVFDTTFCGQWAGAVWDSNPTCESMAETCIDFVSQNPKAFQNSFWLINSVKVYQEGTAAGAKRQKLSKAFNA